MNRVVLVGRLTRDVDLRAVNNGTVGRFTIAVERNFTNASGEREADFISGVIWNKSAENFANFTGKGALVAIEGQLRTGSYQNQQGQTVYTTDVNVDNFTLLETRAQSEARRAANGSAPQSASVNNGGFNTQAQPTATNNSFNAQPQANANNDSQPGTNQSPWNKDLDDNDGYDISEDDLPFE